MYAGVIFAGILLSSCDEVFPPYTEPASVLVGELTSATPDTVEAYFDGFAYYMNTPMIFKVSVTNTYNDLLQGTAQVGGTIVVNSFSQKPRTLTVPITAGNLLAPPVFQGNIAVAPGKQASFSTLWVPYALDKKIVWEGTSYTTIGDARYYGPITFIGSADVRLFQKVQAVKTAELQFKAVFKVKGE